MPVHTCDDRPGTLAVKLDGLDVTLCALFNRLSGFASIRLLFRLVSRLGDGVVWYMLMAVLAIVAGRDGVQIAVQMGLTSLAGLLVYKIIKQGLGRERPYISHADAIVCAMPPLDRYSFPSGHTLHAVIYTVIACSYLPEMGWVLIPFTVLVALSRLVLGLHYPSDVLAGALIGVGLVSLSFGLMRLYAA